MRGERPAQPRATGVPELEVDVVRAGEDVAHVAFLEALLARGISAHGRSGLNVWEPVAEEHAAVAGLAASGWAVRPGERYRLQSPPAIRITVATLRPEETRRLADDVARALGSSPVTRSV